MSRAENMPLPPPPTPEEQLKWHYKRTHDNMEIAKISEFHSDADVRLKLNKLRILGMYPVPDSDEGADMNVARAFLSGVYQGLRQSIKVSRSGGIG